MQNKKNVKNINNNIKDVVSIEEELETNILKKAKKSTVNQTRDVEFSKELLVEDLE